jgi:hypothetical protein
MKLLGSAKVLRKYQMQLIRAVAKMLKADEGDIILFYDDGKGSVILRKG